MGHATSNALLQMQMMRVHGGGNGTYGVLQVKLPDDDKTEYISHRYGTQGDTRHVEYKLFDDLINKFGGTESFAANIPDGARLIFACNYSPCMECTTTGIRFFMNELKKADRKIVMRFIYETIYSRQHVNVQNHPHAGFHLWPNDAAALKAYRDLSEASGTYQGHTVGADGRRQPAQKPYLAIHNSNDPMYMRQ